MKAVFLAVLGACATDDLAFDPARCDAPRTYQIDQVKLPRNSSDLTALALDLDGNGLRDNALGQTSATLIRMFEQVPLDLDARAADHLATDTTWRVSIADCGGETRALAIGQDRKKFGPVDQTCVDGTSTLLSCGCLPCSRRRGRAGACRS